MSLASNVNPRSFCEANKVDAAMLEEPSVFDRQHRVHKDFGHLVVMNHLALGPLVALKKRGNHLRLKLVRVKLAAGTPGNAVHTPFANPNGCLLGAMVGARARSDLDRASGKMVAAHRRLAAL